MYVPAAVYFFTETCAVGQPEVVLCVQVSLPVELASNMCFLETYIQCILSLQRKSGAKKPLPLAIMTSDDTHERTIELLQTHSYFGAKPQQIHLIKQVRLVTIEPPPQLNSPQCSRKVIDDMRWYLIALFGSLHALNVSG